MWQISLPVIFTVLAGVRCKSETRKMYTVSEYVPQNGVWGTISRGGNERDTDYVTTVTVTSPAGKLNLVKPVGCHHAGILDETVFSTRPEEVESFGHRGLYPS